MHEITEKDINNFFINYYDNYYKENNLIYDNIDIFREMIIFICKQLGNYVTDNEESFDWNKIKKATFIEYIPLIEDFYKKLNIDIDINKLIENGTINLNLRTLEELNSAKGKLLNGTNKYEDEHKVVDIFNNGLITDSAILVHELSHYRNQPSAKRGQVNDLFTEALAFAEELIYLDYLNKLGYEYESRIKKYKIMATFIYTAADVNPLVKLHLLFNKLGVISEENYTYLFKYNDYNGIIDIFKETIYEQKKDIIDFDKEILQDEEIMDTLNDNFISDLLYVAAAPLSIYMYEEYKKDNRFIEKIKELNDNLNTNDVVGCLNIIGLTGYNEESLNKVSEAFKSYISELEENKTKGLTK